MMHAIARHLEHHDALFTPYYCDGLLRWLGRSGFLDFTVLGGEMRRVVATFAMDSVSGAGHFLHEERPEAVVEALARMVASLPRQASLNPRTQRPSHSS
jgi:pimeloyl-ACP methyl ester carboxylesterase